MENKSSDKPGIATPGGLEAKGGLEGDPLRKARKWATGDKDAGWLAFLFSAFAKVIAMPFQVFAEVSRRLMGKITGEDLVSKVRDAKRELGDLEEAHDHMNDKFGERVRKHQAEVSAMHLESEILEAERSMRQRMNTAPAGQGMVYESSDTRGSESSGSLPHDGQQSVALPLLPYEIREQLMDVMAHLSPTDVSADAVSYTSWSSWTNLGEDSDTVRESIIASFSEDWSRARKDVLSKPVSDLSQNDISKYLGARFEEELARESQWFMKAARVSPDEFRRVMLRQLAIFAKTFRDDAGRITSTSIAEVMQGRRDVRELGYGDYDVVEEIASALSKDLEMNEAFEQWLAGTDKTRRVGLGGRAPAGYSLPNNGFKSRLPAPNSETTRSEDAPPAQEPEGPAIDENHDVGPDSGWDEPGQPKGDPGMG